MQRFPRGGRRSVKLGCLFLFLGSFACQSTVQRLTRSFQARFGSEETGFPWRTVTDEELITQVLQPQFGAVVQGRPMTDPLRQRLQVWLQKLDESLRARDPSGMQGVPRPEIFLWEEASPRIFATRLDVCLDRKARLQDGEGASEDFLSLDREHRALFAMPGPRSCVPLPYQNEALHHFMSWYLKPFADCSVRVSTRSMDFNPGCLRASLEGARAPAQTRNILVQLSAQWIVISTGLLQSLDEHEAVAMIFHEAAHFYRAHHSQPDALAAIREDSGTSDALIRSRKELAEELLYWRRVQASGERTLLEGVPGQRYHSGLYAVARDGVQAWIKAERERRACKELSQHLLRAPGLTRFPWEKPDERGQTSYEHYEREVDACLADLPLDDAIQQRMIKAVDRLAPWSHKVLPAVPRWTKVKELWDWLDQEVPSVMNAPDRELMKLSQRAEAEGLPLHARETEANALTVAWLETFGIDPQEAVAGVLKLLKLESASPDQTPRPGVFSYEQCARAYAAGFRGGDGRTRRVSAGPYDDPHHNSCHRAFSLHHAIRVRDYALKLPPANVTPPDPARETMAR